MTCYRWPASVMRRRVARHAMIDVFDAPDSTDSTLANEPMENSDAADPMLPMLSTEPIEPMLSTEFVEPMLSTELRDR